MKTRLLFTIFLAFTAVCACAQTQVTFYTSMGNFVACMEQAKRPITTTNFLNLVKNKFYDGIIFHRVVKGFVIQGGDPTGTGSGGSGVTIPDELSPPFSNLQKTLGMATSGPNTATSQFYINLVNNTGLDANYTAFGTVITNFSVVQAIGNVPVNGSRPITKVVMDSVRITFAPTGVDRISAQSSDLSIFPNPVTTGSVVSIHSSSRHAAKVAIYNQLGKQLYCEDIYLSAGVHQMSLGEMHAENFPQGLYYLIVTGNNTISKHAFIVLR
jgi:cyclophilin family peptidyl-prolyl cis-trans isomerase